MVEVNCESDFVARTDDFKELVHDVAMHIAAADPRFLRKEDVPAGGARQGEGYRRAPARSTKASPKRCSTASSKAACTKFYEEVCLLEQPFVKEATLTIDQLVKTKIAKLGENISVARFVRFKVGDVAAAEAGGENLVPESDSK